MFIPDNYTVRLLLSTPCNSFEASLRYHIISSINISVLCYAWCSVVSQSLRLHGPWPTRLLWPWGFSRQEYWSGLPCFPPGDLLNPAIERRSPTLQADSFLSEPPGKPKNTGVGSLSLLRGSSWSRNWTRVSCIAGRFFSSWTTNKTCLKNTTNCITFEKLNNKSLMPPNI